MNNEIENKMNESDASSDCIENTCAERDNIIRGLLFNRTVNVIAVSGREIVETAREIHGTSRVRIGTVEVTDLSYEQHTPTQDELDAVNPDLWVEYDEAEVHT